jgi:hypothetical protein
VHWCRHPGIGMGEALAVVCEDQRYVAPAEAAGMAPGGPPVTEEQWRAGT